MCLALNTFVILKISAYGTDFMQPLKKRFLNRILL